MNLKQKSNLRKGGNVNIKIIRKVDKLGRIVIPKDVRSTLSIKDGDDIEITLENNSIVI
ncbi:MAG: AbrB/MazE/SpoVT family DNA-binding domain-containing protein [Clostridia bacterium]|nr:AbrB/MazE/SpoVT family DNA-binding domain-containing protein [Clostridia bacterium]